MNRFSAPWFVLAMAGTTLIGWLAGSSKPPVLVASGTDRWNERVMLTGPVRVERDQKGSLWAQDAVYILNKSNGLLMAAVSDYKQTVNGRQFLSEFAERDLVKDFALAPGSNAHFLMSTLEIGSSGQGWAPLMVVETESGQFAIYQVEQQITGKSTKPNFQMVERRLDPRLARSVPGANPEVQR